MLKNELDWVIRWDLWRPRALAIRAQFEQNRCVTGGTRKVKCIVDDVYSNVRDPRALAKILEKAEAELKAKKHLDPVIRAYALIVQLRLLTKVRLQPPLLRAVPSGTLSTI